jgi:hypothetical protein
MNKTYDIRYIEQLHQLRRDDYEAAKDLSPQELTERTRRIAAPIFKRLAEMRRQYLESRKTIDQ